MRPEDAPRGRRSKFDIVALLLEIASEGSSKTALVYKSNLNFKVVQRYVDMLRVRELLDVAEEEGAVVYRTTQKGAAALRAIASANELVSGAQGGASRQPFDPGWQVSLSRVRAAFPARELAMGEIFEHLE